MVPTYVSPLLNGVLVITTSEQNSMVKLDFGRYGAVEVPPETAMSFISDQAVRDRIREECNLVHKNRQRVSAELNGVAIHPLDIRCQSSSPAVLASGG